MSDQPVLTEREVLAASRAITELRALREIQKEHRGACLVLDGSPSGFSRLPLAADEFKAVVALLIERHTTVIAALGVTPDVVPA